MRVTLVTGNAKKLQEVRQIVAAQNEAGGAPGAGLDIDSEKVDLPELQGDPLEVARSKALEAYRRLGRPALVDDTSLCFDALGGMPGPYIKWFLDGCGAANVRRMLDGFEDKGGYAQCVFALATGPEEAEVFVGRCRGTIVAPRGDNAFGWDPIFEPAAAEFESAGAGKEAAAQLATPLTFAEMPTGSKHRISHRAKALALLAPRLQQLAAITTSDGK